MREGRNVKGRAARGKRLERGVKRRVEGGDGGGGGGGGGGD